MMLNKTFHLILLSLIPIFGFSQVKNSQYPDSGNKIRLGFQTTGDGLIWRDTQPKVGGYQPINNKAAWIILDTINNKFYHYKDSTWTLAGGQDIDTASMLNNYWRSGRFSGVLPVANGGTNNTSYISGAIPFSNGTTLTSDTSKLFYDASNLRLGLGTSNTTLPFTIFNSNSAMLFQTPSTGLGGQKGFYVGHTGDVSYIYNYQNYPIQIATNNTPRMQILGNGDVGIGTASPAEKLVVAGAIMSTGAITGHGANRTTISQEGANGAFWQSYGGNTTTAGIFQLRQASSDFSIQRVPLYIDASGNVGIGTTTPGALLSLGAGTSVPANTNLFITGGKTLRFGSINTDGNYGSYFQPSLSENGYGVLTIGTKSGGADSPLLTLTGENGGNVGIGTVSPTEKLHVVGNARITAVGTTGTTTNNVPLFIDSSGVLSKKGVLPVANGGTGKSTLTANKIMVGNGTDGVLTPTNLHWDNTNNRLGINISNPLFALDVFSAGGIRVNEDGIGTKVIHIRSDFAGVDPAINVATSNSLLLQTANTERMRITSTGNVGIGTTGPTEKLHVDGNARITGNISVGSATPTTSGTGITFPATQSASTNLNTLDDYEEGTFTSSPTAILNCSSINVSSTYYLKIGGYVYYSITGTLTVTASNAVTVLTYSPPFTQSTTSDNQGGTIAIYRLSGGVDNYSLGVALDNSSGESKVAATVPAVLQTFSGASANFYINGALRAN